MAKAKASKRPKASQRPAKRLSKAQLERRRRLIAQRKRRYNEAAWQRNGLVKPDTSTAMLEPGSKQFEKLRKAWYAKLAASEASKPDAEQFKDIEWADNPDSRHVKAPASRGRKLTPGKQLYYALGRNFLTHFRFRSLQEKTAWAMHIDGKSYRLIHEHLKTHFKLRKSIYWLFYYVKATAAKCKRFNTEHAEGLLNAGNQDSFADDVLIGDFRLQSANNEDADYGMPVDSGYWESVPKPKG